jgi:hypothetical protein
MTGQWHRFFAFALRDGLLVALTAGLWLLTLRSGPPHGIGGIALHLFTGLMTVLCGFFLHEWGHMLAAWAAGSAFELPARFADSPFLFRFNNVRNSRAQFCWMSLGGFAASIAFVAFLLLALPGHLLASYVAQGVTAIGVLATLITEVPGLVKVMRGAPLPQGSAYVSD